MLAAVIRLAPAVRVARLMVVLLDVADGAPAQVRLGRQVVAAV